MFIRTLDELAAAGRIKSLVNDTTRSARFLTRADGMGFSYNENRVSKGSDAVLSYKHHWEANYIISGRGEVTDLTTGQTWPLEPGVLYVVGPNDRHRFRVTEDEYHFSVFCPPLRGDERHDEDGGYPANGQARTLRMLTRADDLGFGFSDVHFAAGAEATLWYEHHWEANHIISGTGEVTDLTTGQSWKLKPGVAYNVGPKDRHRLRTDTDMHLISVLCPPLQGDEQHDADGALAPSGRVPPGPEGY